MNPLRRKALAWLLALSLAAPACAAPPALWLLASVDHTDSGLMVRVLRDESGWYYLRRLDARMLELALQDAPELRFEDEIYLRVDALVRHRLLLDEDRQRVHFLSPATASFPAVSSLQPTPAQTDLSVGVSEAAPQPQRALRSTPPAQDSAQLPAPAAAGSLPMGEESEDEILLLDLTVNAQAMPGVWQARQEGNDLWLDAAMLAAAGVLAPAGFEQAAELPLSALSGGQYLLDRNSLQLDMTVSPELLMGSRFGLDPGFTPGPPPDTLSAILGYVLSASAADGSSRAAGLFDLTLARGRATCTSSHHWRQGQRFRRLDSSCRLDWPERTLSMELGDSVADGARLQPGVRFTGLRIGSDFSLNPYLRTLPDFRVQGSARLPSTLELWIDQQLALRSEIPPGPFDIRDIPTHTGSGELRAVVTDALGRQTIIGAPVFVDLRLLRTGLLDWSAEAGRLRLGQAGRDEFGPRFAALSLRRGMSNRLTADLRAEVWDGGANFGLGGVTQVGVRGLLELGFAGSKAHGMDGHAWQAGYSYRANRLSFGLRQSRYSRDFASLAWQEGEQAPARQTHASTGLAFSAAQLNLAWVDRRLRNGDQHRFASASLQFRAFGRASVSLSLSHAPGRRDDTRIGLFISLPLDSGLGFDSSLRHGRSGPELVAGLRRHAPIGPGFGWRARAQHGPGGERAELDALWRTGWSELGLAVSQDQNGTALRGDVSGTVIAAAGGVYAARREPGSYALVDAGLPGVRVLRDNQVAAITGANGRALIPGLRPFQSNQLRLALEDLPLATRIAQDSLVLVPGLRQVLPLAFGVQRVRYLSTRLQREDGSSPPPGARVQVEGMSEPDFVGYEGEIFVQVPEQALVTINANWNSSRCRATVLIEAHAESLIELRQLPCIDAGDP